jgi:hypothetical protein
MSVLKLLLLSLLTASCVDVDDELEDLETSTESSALTNRYSLCVNGQINTAELARMDKDVRINPILMQPISEPTITAGRAFLLRGNGYATLPAGSYLEILSILPNGTAQVTKAGQMAVTSSGELLVIPPAPLPTALLNMLNLKFEVPCGATRITRVYGFNFRPSNPNPPSATPPGGLGDVLGLTATPLSSSTVRLTWKDSGPSGESGFLMWFRVRGATTFQLAGATVTDDLVEDLGPFPAGTELEFQVQSYDGLGFGRRSQTALAKTPAGAPAPGAGTGVVMQPPREAQSLVDLSEIAFPFNRPPLDCIRSAAGAPTNCRFLVTAVEGVFDRNGDGIVGPAVGTINSKLWPLEQNNSANATITQTETIQGRRFAPTANLIVFGLIQPVTAGAMDNRGITKQFVAFHIRVAANGVWTIIDVRGGDFMHGANAMVMTMDGARTSTAGFTLPTGNTLGRITGGAKLEARLSGFDNRAMPFPGQAQQPSPYTGVVRLTVASQGAPIHFDE